jgi:hypothetical protein
MPTQLKMTDHNYHTALSVSETALAEIIGQTLATAYIEGGTQALVPVYNVLCPPLSAALRDADRDFDERSFAAKVEAAEDAYLHAAEGHKTGARNAAL